MKVLMVDDSSADRHLYRLLLEETLGRGLELLEAVRAEEGIRRCREEAPDCVLLDYRLPDMTGLEFLREVRGDMGDVPEFAVIMLTGLADEQTAVEAMKAGAQDYLVKDRITPEGLHSAIQRAMEKVALLRDLKRERDRIAASLAEKEVLLKEVHHRVKNNLQVIASLLRLQADSLPDPVPAAALRESQNRVESMALVHEQLYHTRDLREINLAEHVALLAQNLFHIYGDPARLSYTVAVEATPLGVDQAIPASLILNELISNSLKHAFPDGRAGAVRIEGGRSGGCISMAVSDNGAGIPAHVDLARSKSLGLEIVRILTRQLKGSFEVERGNGTSFRIHFPDHAN
ncbi:MAG: response regulator [Acidobacteriia bacterium]|nr:response regulator [Terriglobia bacterium]